MTTRERVLRAARAVFASQGYAGASMRRIAADAGLTAMALYTYAPSKAELFRLVYEDGIARIYAEFASVVAGKATLVEEVGALLDRGGQLLDEDPDLLRFTIRVVIDRDHEELTGLDLLTEPYLAFFEDLARRAVRRGDVDRSDTVRLVELVTMLLWGITTAAALEPSKVGAAVEVAKWAAEGRLAQADADAAAGRSSPAGTSRGTV